MKRQLFGVRVHMRCSQELRSPILLRLPPPSTEHDLSGSSRLTSMHDEAIYLMSSVSVVYEPALRQFPTLTSVD